jgi:drug/metabolite transporter (DMT)-like permease
LVEVILFAFIIVAGTGGELCVSRAMKAVGEVKDFRPAAIARVIGRALRVGWMWAGVGLMALAFFSLLGALSILNYVTGALGAVFFLREHVSRRRWAGVFLVSLGVTLVFLGNR